MNWCSRWGVFRARLFRDSCVFHRGNYVKDLNSLGRDLRRVVIVDNSPASYIFHPDNAVSHLHHHYHHISLRMSHLDSQLPWLEAEYVHRDRDLNQVIRPSLHSRGFRPERPSVRRAIWPAHCHLNKLILTDAVNTRTQGRTDSGSCTFLVNSYIRQNEGLDNEWKKLMGVIALAHLCMYKYIYLPDCYTACTGCPWGFKFQFRLFFVLTPSAISSANVVPVVCVKVVISVTSKIIVLS